MQRILAILLVLAAGAAYGRDLGQWEKADPAIKAWYKSVMMPDSPGTPCCGEADAYWADSFEQTPNGLYVAIITDDRVVEGRPPVPNGTRIVVPNHKLTFKHGNPTGHGIIFMRDVTYEAPGGAPNYYVYCYLPPGGG